jgi:tRNA1Val (adenine37-N6)-methyltransferase
MSNSYFQFKQFRIRQDRCAMKVCTDACLFGAWFSQRIPAGARVLDIGSGTGLLMLMLAQRHSGGIQGIELDPEAFGQLQENIAQSPWPSRLQVFQGDVRDFVFAGKFDLVISNPPFFEYDLPAANGPRNLARHGESLKLSELIRVIDMNLEERGSFGLLLPDQREEYFVELAASHGFWLSGRIRIRQRTNQEFFRSILHFSREENIPFASAALTISNADGTYTEDFVDLLRDYYLYL